MASRSEIQPSGIVALPPELVATIADFVHPPAIVDLACTCQFLFNCCRETLKSHKTAHTAYRTVSDVQPTTIPNLLRKLLVDPVPAWHVRDLEFCYGRRSWNSWKTFDFRIEESSRSRGMPPPPDYAFSQDERTVLLDLLRKDFHFEEKDIDLAREDLEKGIDAPLKLALFALCPHIRSLKFTRHVTSTGRNAFESTSPPNLRRGPRSTLDYIQRAILPSLTNEDLTWPAGLSSLTDIQLGVVTGTEIDELNPTPGPHLFADLMQLPNLNSFYCYGVTQEIDDIDADSHEEGDAPYNLVKGNSSVQDIFLDAGNGLGWNFKKAIVTGCEQLKSLTVAHSETDDIDVLVSSAGRANSNSMETLMFYGTERLHGYRCSMYRNEELQHYNNLRTIYIAATDLMLDAFYNYEGKVEPGPDHEWIGDYDFFVDFVMNQAFPESMEVLVLGASHSQLLEADAEMLDQAITTMIETMQEPDDSDDDDQDDRSETSRKSFECRFSNLKAVYLGALEEININTARHEPSSQPRQKRWFSKSIAAGRKAGVDVHTRTTRGQPLHDIEFPKPPSMLDLKSSPDPPAEPLVFNVYTGRWGPEGCGNCGQCESCLRLYEASVWQEVENEDVQDNP